MTDKHTPQKIKPSTKPEIATMDKLVQLEKIHSHPFINIMHHMFHAPFVITEIMFSPWRSFFPYSPWPVKPLEDVKITSGEKDNNQ
jgi:hypothetical protein